MTGVDGELPVDLLDPFLHSQHSVLTFGSQRVYFVWRIGNALAIVGNLQPHFARLQFDGDAGVGGVRMLADVLQGF